MNLQRRNILRGGLAAALTLPVEKLELTKESNCPTAGFMLHAQALAKAKLTATYVTE